MERSARIFNCARCFQPTVICQDCDRGNIYCNSDCSQTARKENIRKSSERYQNTRKGRLKHAARQKRYQERKALTIKKMTHHSYDEITSCVPLMEADEIARQIVSEEMCCNFCGRICSKFVRMDFLHSSAPMLANKTSVLIRGP